MRGGLMKILTVVIPCYNSEAYMCKAIDHALIGGPDVEVLIVDDGSKDNTLRIARDYEKRYPDIVRAVHQENKGHGGALNTGLENATGLYFKVCDSDDYLDYDAYIRVLNVLRRAAKSPKTIDVMINNYMYDKQGARHKKVMRYKGFFPEHKVFTWKDIKHRLPNSKYVLMHSLIYRTELLRESGVHLPEHTFYVDNLMAFQPMIYAKNLYYLDVTLYRYFIGRNDQSVNEDVMLTRLDQQLRVNKMMIDEYRPHLVEERRHLTYLVHYMSIMMSISSILLMRKGDKASLAAKKELWDYLKAKDKLLFARLRAGFLGMALNMPTAAGRKIAIDVYHLVQKIYGFN